MRIEDRRVQIRLRQGFRLRWTPARRVGATKWVRLVFLFSSEFNHEWTRINTDRLGTHRWLCSGWFVSVASLLHSHFLLPGRVDSAAAVPIRNFIHSRTTQPNDQKL